MTTTSLLVRIVNIDERTNITTNSRLPDEPAFVANQNDTDASNPVSSSETLTYDKLTEQKEISNQQKQKQTQLEPEKENND